MEKKQVFNVRAIAVIAVMSALAFILMLLESPIPAIIPPFIKFDFSDLPAIIVSFAFGPLAGAAVCVVKNLLHLLFFFSNSNGVGELANAVLGIAFVVPAGIIYKRNKCRKTAFAGSIAGALISAAISLPLNYFFIYPAYVVLYGMPMEAIIGMYSSILSWADNLWKCLLVFNFPFTFIKELSCALITFAVYKKLSPLLKGKNR